VENSKAIKSLDARNKLLEYKSDIQGMQAALKVTEENLTSATETAAKPVSTKFLQISSENQEVSNCFTSSEPVQATFTTTFSNKKLLETPRVSKVNQEINSNLLSKYLKDDTIT